MRKPPNIRYWAGPSATIAWALSAAEKANWFSLIPFDISWGELSIALFIFFLGQIVSDYCNDSSWLVWKINELRSLFVIENTSVGSANDDGFTNLLLSTKIKFTKDAKNIKIIIRAHSDIDLKHAYEVFILHSRSLDSVAKDDVIKFDLATVPISSPHGEAMYHRCWGAPVKPGEKKMHKNVYGSNVVEVEVSSGKLLKQKELIFFNIMKDVPASKFFITYGNKPSSLDVLLPSEPE